MALKEMMHACNIIKIKSEYIKSYYQEQTSTKACNWALNDSAVVNTSLTWTIVNACKNTFLLHILRILSTVLSVVYDISTGFGHTRKVSLINANVGKKKLHS